MNSQMRVIRVAHRLVDLAANDSLYADRYLERATQLLDTTFPRRQYVAMRDDYESVPRLTKDLRDAVEKQDWQRSLMLATRVSTLRTRVLVRAPFLRIGDEVYGSHPVRFTGTALALNGVVAGHCADLPQTRASTVEQLGTLAREDQEWGTFYRHRIEYFEHLHIAAEQQPGAVIEGKQARDRILAAVDKADFTQVQALVNAILSRDTGAAGRFRGARPRDAVVSRLADGFSVTDAERLRRLGLKEEVLPAQNNLNEYLGCGCTDRPTLPASPLAGTHRKAETCTCGHDCPPEIRGVLRENLDLLMLHAFVTSCGTRYLPWFGAETLLVETFAESDSDVRTPLLDMLQLPKRVGLARITIEDALRARGGCLVRELGLDPTDFVVTCIPFDAYLRLAPSHGWGREERWTHFDGYQVCRDLRLRALVGGDVNFGGPDDLCSVGCDYDSTRLTVRFAVVRRQRVTVRGGTVANEGRESEVSK